MGKLFKIASEDLLRLKHPRELNKYGNGESNFKADNPSFDELVAKVKTKLGMKVDETNLDNIIPDFLILEYRDGNYYEILTNVLVAPYKNYFEGVGVFFKVLKLKKITATELKRYINDIGTDIDYVHKRINKFAFMANNAQYHLYSLNPTYSKYNDLDEQIGAELIKKI